MRCQGCGNKGAPRIRTLCPYCRSILRYRFAAKNRCCTAIAKAKAEGRLPLLDGSIECVDCGKPATCWEHRDYNRPLDVEPTCASCNMRRGPGRFVPGEVPPGALARSDWVRAFSTRPICGVPQRRIPHLESTAA